MTLTIQSFGNTTLHSEKIGNNLNQIAKRMNTTGNVYAVDVKELMKQLYIKQ